MPQSRENLSEEEKTLPSIARGLSYSYLKSESSRIGFDFELRMRDIIEDRRGQEARDYLLARGFSDRQIDDFGEIAQINVGGRKV